MYQRGPQQLNQMTKTYEIALERLADMESQRDELNEAIGELKAQIEWGEQQINELRANGPDGSP